MAQSQEQPTGLYAKFKAAVKALKREILAINYALEDPAVGWLPRVLALFTIAYALSPLDLIPDFIPILGLIDDLIILPAFIFLTIKLIPHDVMENARHRAENEPLRLGKNWVMATIFFIMWDVLLGWLVLVLCRNVGVHYSQQLKWVGVYSWWIVSGVVAVAVVVEIVWMMKKIKEERRREEAAAMLRESLLEP